MHYSRVKVNVWSWSFGASSFPTEPLRVLQMPDLHLNFDFSVSVASRNTCALRFVRPIWVQCFVVKVCVTWSIYLKNSCSWCVFKVGPFFFFLSGEEKIPHISIWTKKASFIKMKVSIWNSFKMVILYNACIFFLEL